VSISKPNFVFDRDAEWADLCGFVTASARGARLGLVYGRRRQGKTLLLEALCEATGGFIWQARQQSSTQNLRDLEGAIGRFGGVVPRLSTWDEAISALLDLKPTDKSDRPIPVVIDEIGYVLDDDSAFASRLQAALSPAMNRRRRSSVRLILCGSAFGQMRRLVDAGAPLRGRAQLDLVVPPFGFRESAQYWELAGNPDLAFRLHALVGGTPAYREYVAGVGPKRGDLDTWVAKHLLSPSSPLFREGKVSVAEDPALSDRSLYWAVLGAVADGAATRGEITSALGRPPTSLHHALQTLTEAGWLAVEQDPLRSRGGRFVVDEPIVRFHRLVIEPADAQLAKRGTGRAVWDDALPLVRARIFARHLEHLARQWLLLDASEDTAGSRVRLCGPSAAGSGARRLQLDVLATGVSAKGSRRVCAVGEVKSGRQPIGKAELDRLDRAVGLLPPATSDAPVKRILFARSGFTRELEQAARRRPDLELVDLHRLYNGE
jgi:uncharacterized protein